MTKEGRGYLYQVRVLIRSSRAIIAENAFLKLGQRVSLFFVCTNSSRISGSGSGSV
jgi:hypothetical protein